MKNVGQILAEARKNKGLSLFQVEAGTKIRRKTLELLEEGDWSALPSPTFVKGLLRNYASFLGLNPNDIIAFYRREFDEKKNKTIQKPILNSQKRFRLTPKWVTVAVAALAIVGIISYLFIQYRSFTGAPLLEVDEPKDNIKIQNGEVNVVGRTWPDADLKINGQDVQLSAGGSFSVAVSLPEGVNTITITAANRFGKIATQKRTLVVDLAEKTASTSARAGLVLNLKVGPNSAAVTVETDGKTAFEGVLSSGANKTFQAQDKIRILTQNAGSTEVNFQGNDEVLGKEGETVEKFYPPGS